jgi:hypothetical protein
MRALLPKTAAHKDETYGVALESHSFQCVVRENVARGANLKQQLLWTTAFVNVFWGIVPLLRDARTGRKRTKWAL